MRKDYSRYFLSDNPFPEQPTVNPDSTDRRTDGTIYNEEIFAEELAALKTLVQRKINLIYAESRQREKGVGKSALIAREWRKLQYEPTVTSVYVQSQPKYKPRDFCDKIVADWHQKSYLWNALRRCLKVYVESTSYAAMPKASLDKFLEMYPNMVQTVNLRPFGVHNPDRFITGISTWAFNQIPQITLKVAGLFFKAYLSAPQGFLAAYTKGFKRDQSSLFKSMLQVMKLGGYEYHYFFFDQFEEMIHERGGGKDLTDFTIGMRKMIEDCDRHATIIVTMHPDASRILGNPEGAHLIRVAPLDERHKIDLEPIEPDDAVKLAITYLQEFRQGDPPNDLFPFEEALVKNCFWRLAKGNVGDILRFLYTALEVAMENDQQIIDYSFAHDEQRHRAITGKALEACRQP